MKGRTRVSNLSLARVKEVLDYDPDTGAFLWRVSTAKNVKIGAVAGGTAKAGGYRYISIDGEEITCARLAWLYVTGAWPARRIRFKNGDKADLRFENMTQFNGIGGEYDHTTKTGRASYLRAYRQASPEIEKARSLRASFGLSLGAYRDMLEAQGSACAICSTPETQKRGEKVRSLAVDHDHKIGAIRGLLCSDCNTGIGKLKDSRDILLSAVKYLDKHSGKEAKAPNLTIVGRA